METIIVNHYEQSTITSALAHLKSIQDEEVILRVPLSKGDDFGLGVNVRIDQISQKKETEGEDERPISYSSVTHDGNLLSLVDLFRSAEDIDVIQSMGFSVLEVLEDTSSSASASASSTSTKLKVNRDVFPTIKRVVEYLRSLGASYVAKDQEETDEFDLDSKNKWIGKDEDKNGVRTSTMYFQTSYKYMKLSRIQALAFLTSRNDEMSKTRPGKMDFMQGILGLASKSSQASKSDELPPYDEKNTKFSRPYTSTILVLKNNDCVFSLVPGSSTDTEPESKARLLYLFDCIRAWVRREEANKWLNINFIQELSDNEMKNTSFDYKTTILAWTSKTAEAQVPGVSSTPQIDDKHIFIQNNLILTPFFSAFTPPTSTDKSPEERIEAMKQFIRAYGLDFSNIELKGDVKDYLKNATIRFILPTRSTPSTAKVMGTSPNGNAGIGGKTTSSQPFRKTNLALAQPRSSITKDKTETPSTSSVQSSRTSKATTRPGSSTQKEQSPTSQRSSSPLVVQQPPPEKSNTTSSVSRTTRR